MLQHGSNAIIQHQKPSCYMIYRLSQIESLVPLSWTIQISETSPTVSTTDCNRVLHRS